MNVLYQLSTHVYIAALVVNYGISNTAVLRYHSLPLRQRTICIWYYCKIKQNITFTFLWNVFLNFYGMKFWYLKSSFVSRKQVFEQEIDLPIILDTL